MFSKFQPFEVEQYIEMKKHGAASRVVWLFALTLLSVLCIGNAHADGVYIPERAYKKPPAIPSQRAILKYRDGVETLVIESSLDAEGQAFGWIIPVPSEPSDFRKVSPGLLKTFSNSIQPRIIHDLGLYHSKGNGHFWFVAIVTIFAFFAIAFRLRWIFLPIAFTISLLLASLFLSAHKGLEYEGDVGKIHGVDVKKVVRVGSYKLTVLKAKSAKVLDAWLNENGFAEIPADAQPIVSEYVEDEWHFVVVKLNREGSGFSTPHPLEITFPAKKAVYPLKLTAFADSQVSLELFVCSDMAARINGLTLDYCDRHEIYPGYQGITFQKKIAHPEAKDFLWHNCVVTRLSGNMNPEDMGNDLLVDFKQFKPYQRRLYSEQGATQTGINAVMWIWSLGLILGIAVMKERIRARGGRFYAFRCIVLPLLAICLLTWCVIYTALPKVEVTTTRGGYSRSHHHLLTRVASLLVAEHPAILDTDASTIAQYLVEGFEKEKMKNPFTGAAIQVEDSPGNFTIIKGPNGVVIQAFGYDGELHEEVLRTKQK